MNLPPPPQDDDPIITQFKPAKYQWELTDENIKRIDPETGQTILHNYCQRINTTPLEVYRYLIERKGCDVNAQDKSNDTPVHLGFRAFDQNDGGNITVLMYLLGHENVNVNIKGKDGHTLLVTACNKINKLPLEIFKLLIETQGCDVNAQDNGKDTPVHLALRRFHPEGGGMTGLMYLLGHENVNVNIKGQSGYTILHYACMKINELPLDVFKVLIETKGFDVNAQDDNKNTPIHSALDQFKPHDGGDINVLAYLINQTNINVNIGYKMGYTLLHTACIINLSKNWYSAELNAEECDTILCQIVEMIANKCLEQVLDGKPS
jgi:ankyrin repeat protein